MNKQEQELDREEYEQIFIPSIIESANVEINFKLKEVKELNRKNIIEKYTEVLNDLIRRFPDDLNEMFEDGEYIEK